MYSICLLQIDLNFLRFKEFIKQYEKANYIIWYTVFNECSICPIVKISKG